MGRRFFRHTEEGVRQQPVGVLIRKILPLFAPHKPLLFGAFALLIPVTAALLTPGLVLQHIFDKVIPAGDFQALYLLVLILIGVILIGTSLGYVQAIALFKLGLTIITDIKGRLYEHTLRLGLGFHEEHPPGKLLSRVESDTETLGALFGEISMNLLKNFIMFVGILVILCIRNFSIAVWILILVPLLFGAVFWFLTAMSKYWREMRTRTAILINYVAEYVQGVEVIQQFNYQPKARERMDEVNWGRFRVRIPAATLGAGFWAGFMFGEIIAIIIIIVVGYRGIVAGNMTVGTLVLFIEYVRLMYMPILRLSGELMFLQRSLVSVERVFGILETERTIKDGPRAPDSLAFNGDIRFENVWFAYEGEQWVLEDVSFTIRKGEKIALVGTSGGGKSTIVSLLLRYYDPNRGKITVDGVDIREFPVKTWRKLVGLVLQDIFLFPGTVRENISVFQDSISDSKIRQATEIAHADTIIESLPGEYDGEISERGSNLSIGERQLLSFARALAYDPPVLVLDEATSSVDPFTERLVQQALDRLLKGRTAVIVAHRLSTIVNSDRILLVQDGRIMERGTHDELIARDGIYAKLARLQFAEIEIPNPGEEGSS